MTGGNPASEASGRIRLGTSSWTAAGWERAFYPPGTDGAERIEFYSRHFDTVEIDMTFYRVPGERTVLTWRDRTPPGFLFAVKAPQEVTSPVLRGGVRREKNPGFLSPEPLARFVERMRLLGERLGPILLQFPYLARRVYPEPELFFEALDDLLAVAPGGIQYAVELRNPSWFGPDLLDLLRSHGAALALTDLTLTRGDGGKYGPPTGPDLLERLGEEIWTADFLFVRWLGDRVGIEALTETWERVVQARNEELGRWSDLLAGAAARGRDVHAYANNHYEGFAPETIRKVRALLADRAGDPGKVC